MPSGLVSLGAGGALGQEQPFFSVLAPILVETSGFYCKNDGNYK